MLMKQKEKPLSWIEFQKYVREQLDVGKKKRKTKKWLEKKLQNKVDSYYLKRCGDLKLVCDVCKVLYVFFKYDSHKAYTCEYCSSLLKNIYVVAR